jgi:signal transduction histidine kinase
MVKSVGMAAAFYILFIFIAAFIFNTGETVIEHDGISACAVPENLLQQGPVKVKMRDVEFYPNQYLTPADIVGNNYTITGFTPAQYATQRMVLHVPPGEAYAIKFTLPGYAGKVFVNGRLEKTVGTLGTSAEEIKMDYGWCVLHARPVNGELELVIQSANFLYAHWDIPIPEINIIYASMANTEYYIFNLNSLLSMGGLFGSALLLLGLWVYYPNVKQNIWFSLLCLLMAVRGGLTSHNLRLILPFLSFDVSNRILYATTPLMVIFIILYFGKVFPGNFRRLVKIVVPVSFVFIVFTTFWPYPVITATFNYIYFFAMVLIIYAAAQLVRHRKMLTSGHVLALAGTAIFFIGSLADLVLYMGILPGRSYWKVPGTLAEVSLMVFTVTQMISLFTQNIQQAVQAGRDKEELVVKNALLEQMNIMKTELLGDISHELKTPLTVISGYAQTADLQLSAGDAHRELVNKMKIIASEAERLGLLVSQTLTAARIEEGQLRLDMQTCDAAEIVHTAIETYYPILNKNNNRLELVLDPNLPVIYADKYRLSHVIVNLISNSLRHLCNGIIQVTALEQDGYIVYTVKDTGTGIAPEILPHIFERFVSREQQPDLPGAGTGLGLYISKYIVERHGGKISVESRVGEGTTVTFSVPVYAPGGVVLK